jgi:uncharacterized protein HemY
MQTGKLLIIIGLILVITGAIIWIAGDKLDWFGRLPGDIRIEKENTRIYFPITTMLIVSAVLSLIMYIIKKLS